MAFWGVGGGAVDDNLKNKKYFHHCTGEEW